MTPPEPTLTPYADALAAVLAAAAGLGTERVALADAAGRILAEDLCAPFDLPRFDNTAVDGYAVHADDLARAQGPDGVELRAGPVIPAGAAEPDRALTAGTATRVFTGARLPAGTAAVVMQEDVGAHGSSLRFPAGLVAGQHIRRQGGEFRQGDVVVRAPQALTPPRCALAASLGLTHLAVARAPRVGLLLTGRELVAPGSPLAAAQIYESNGAGLAAALRLGGLAAPAVRSAPDTLAATVAALAELLDTNDVVLTSGGVSVGAGDTVKEALAQLGVERRIWRVAIKPGKPFYFGVRTRAGRTTAVFGLPGNPLSALVTYTMLALPYLRAVQGAPVRPAVTALLATAVRKEPGRLEFVPVTLDRSAPGWRAHPLGARASHMLAGLAQADALAVLPAELASLAAGEPVACHLLPWS